MTNSYALFTNEVTGTKTIEITPNLNLDKSGANEPVLDSSMIPVYYDETDNVWKKADQSNKSKTYKWYDYDNKMWANSVTVSSTNRSTYQSASLGTPIPMDDILTMQVWIPRYKYKVWNYNSDGTKTSSPQQIEITFEKENKNTSEITCQDAISGTEGKPSETCKLKSTNTTCTDSTCNNKTYTHPAFTFGNEEIKGFWIGKFELSGAKPSSISLTSSSDDSIVKVMPLAGEISTSDCVYYDGTDATGNCSDFLVITKSDVPAIVNNAVSDFETNIMNMKNSNNIYGLSASTDTHMIKNMEWGAVAYLSHSKYGTCSDGVCSEVSINNSSNYITGRSAGIPSSSSVATSYDGTYTYETLNGQKASTTSNIYGVYDMSGGAWEYTMGNVVGSDGKNMLTVNSGFSTYPDIKYYDKYSYSTSNSSRIRSKLGDGIREVYNTGNYAWYSDTSYLAYASRPWFLRGGGTTTTGAEAGLFYSYYYYGSSLKDYSTRMVIVLE